MPLPDLSKQTKPFKNSKSSFIMIEKVKMLWVSRCQTKWMTAKLIQSGSSLFQKTIFTMKWHHWQWHESWDELNLNQRSHTVALISHLFLFSPINISLILLFFQRQTSLTGENCVLCGHLQVQEKGKSWTKMWVAVTKAEPLVMYLQSNGQVCVQHTQDQAAQ